MRNLISDIKKEHRWKEFENMMSRRTSGSKKDKIIGAGENCIMTSFITRALAKFG
jgi:hypothetical protein